MTGAIATATSSAGSKVTALTASVVSGQESKGILSPVFAASANKLVQKGTVQSFSVRPNPGYTLRHIYFDAGAGPITTISPDSTYAPGSVYTFKVTPDSDKLDVKVDFAEILDAPVIFKVNVRDDITGKVLVSGSSDIKYSNGITVRPGYSSEVVSAVASSTYDIAGVSVTGSPAFSRITNWNVNYTTKNANSNWAFSLPIPWPDLAIADSRPTITVNVLMKAKTVTTTTPVVTPTPTPAPTGSTTVAKPTTLPTSLIYGVLANGTRLALLFGGRLATKEEMKLLGIPAPVSGAGYNVGNLGTVFCDFYQINVSFPYTIGTRTFRSITYNGVKYTSAAGIRMYAPAAGSTTGSLIELLLGDETVAPPPAPTPTPTPPPAPAPATTTTSGTWYGFYRGTGSAYQRTMVNTIDQLRAYMAQGWTYYGGSTYETIAAWVGKYK